jgi:hypothetical protein
MDFTSLIHLSHPGLQFSSLLSTLPSIKALVLIVPVFNSIKLKVITLQTVIFLLLLFLGLNVTLFTVVAVLVIAVLLKICIPCTLFGIADLVTLTIRY